MASPAAEKKTLRIRICEEFAISEPGAALSETLKNMSADVADGVINLSNVVHSSTAAMIIAYLETHADEGLSEEEKANFDRDFASGKDFNFLKKLIIGAHNLKIEGLTSLLATKMANIIKTKSGKWGRRAIFGPDADPTPEEKAEWRREFPWNDWAADDELERLEDEQEAAAAAAAAAAKI